MSFKQAAEELLKIADEIERDASEVTKFVCESCNHTASLASINGKRKTAAEDAKKAGENVTVTEITVNDKVFCPACNGKMAYSPTPESEKYYFDPDKKATDDKDEDDKGGDPGKGKEEPEVPAKPAEEPKPAEKTAAIDYDSLQRYLKK